MKTALITGITGQDGAYLAEFLLAKGYTVHGIKRRSSLFNTDRIDHLYRDPHDPDRRFVLHHGDMTDSTSLIHIIQKTQPDEIYNLAAQSHVAVSFEEPEYTANSDALGALRVLEAIRILGLETKTRFYQASTSELFGQVQETPQKETTPFYPRSPYAVAKLYAYWITINYREAYGIYACNGILFNHESPIRGETFVTRKITRALARIQLGLQDTLYLGNLDAKRDWGHAKDYVEMQWLMLQQEQPEDFVIATGQQYSVRDFVNAAAKELGMEIRWEGEGVAEKGYWLNRPTTVPASPEGASQSTYGPFPSSLRGAAGDAAVQPPSGLPRAFATASGLAMTGPRNDAEIASGPRNDAEIASAPAITGPRSDHAADATVTARSPQGDAAVQTPPGLPRASGPRNDEPAPIVAVDPRYFRPTEVETLLGDATKAREKLGWTPRITFHELVAEMVREDLETAKRDHLVRNSGFTVMDHHE